MKKRNLLKHKNNFSTKFAITLFGLALIGLGAWGYWQKYQATHIVTPTTQPQSTQAVTVSTDMPGEAKPETCDAFSAGAGFPIRIDIPSINTKGCIQKVGIDQNGAIAVPTNIHVAGWFVESVKPGEMGVSIIDGHVSGRYDKGIFKHIINLKPGELVSIESGDNTKQNFEVVRVDSYSVEETNGQQYIQLPGIQRQLTLITCGGSFDGESQSYNQRVVVRAKLVQR